MSNFGMRGFLMNYKIRQVQLSDAEQILKVARRKKVTFFRETKIRVTRVLAPKWCKSEDNGETSSKY